MKGKKAVPQKAVPKKAVPNKKAAPKKATPNAPKGSVTKKQAVLRNPKKSENLLADREVCRKFTMTVQVSGHEYLTDPVAATRRVLILALTKIPAKIHEEQFDNGSLANGMVNGRADIHFNGVINDPGDPTGADLRTIWQWQPSDR